MKRHAAITTLMTLALAASMAPAWTTDAAHQLTVTIVNSDLNSTKARQHQTYNVKLLGWLLHYSEESLQSQNFKVWHPFTLTTSTARGEKRKSFNYLISFVALPTYLFCIRPDIK